MTIPRAWAHLPFFTENYPSLAARIADDPRQILPPEDQRFAALDLVAPAQVRVVILGQDPYPTPGHAHGLAFSVEPDVRPLPRSLNNIFKELQEDLGHAPPNGDLRFWARQGVLLLNTALSVPAGEAGAHAKWGWSALTHQVLAHLSDAPRAFVLWGKHAQGFAPSISAPKPASKPNPDTASPQTPFTTQDHLILHSPHPSPLSARRGFFGSRPFSTVNNWLTSLGQDPINWTEPRDHE